MWRKKKEGGIRKESKVERRVKEVSGEVDEMKAEVEKASLSSSATGATH